ncbi:hypothetical protein, partial [Nocardia brasiliensis]|uniref:hypothetical protein n=1 Tax=Nocardia brasiliensis TaxID=37326 RepID=UPI0024565081
AHSEEHGVAGAAPPQPAAKQYGQPGQISRAEHKAHHPPPHRPRLTTLCRGGRRAGGPPHAMFLGMGSAGRGPGEGWRRYLALMLDAMRPAAATALPPFDAAAATESPRDR